MAKKNLPFGAVVQAHVDMYIYSQSGNLIGDCPFCHKKDAFAVPGCFEDLVKRAGSLTGWH